jgi:lipoic acid synthetase
MRGLELNTVCEDAHCPNIGECWHHGTATFMILGDVCTRACAYCAVAHGKPAELDLDEPRRVADAVKAMGLKYAVVTSVDRDDQADGGAGLFAQTIREIRVRMPDTRVEVLIPDFKGDARALYAVLDARPDVLNHNTETVPRLYRMARSGGKYSRTLELLERSRAYAPQIPTKTGLMVGLGEGHDELIEVFRDLRRVGVAILTIGQYLRPSPAHASMTRYYHPDEFAGLKRAALDLGFVHVEAGPLVRSSYHAHEQADAARAAGTRSRL